MRRPSVLNACLFGCLMLVLWTNAVAAQVNSLAAPNGDEELTSTQALEDLDVLQNALKEAHDGLYRFSTKRKMDGRLEQYRSQLNRPITKLAFIGLISEMLSSTRDGHMRLEYDEPTTVAMRNARLFPFRLMIDGPRPIVLFNDSPTDTSIRPGMELLRINGRAAGDVLSLILSKMPGDGFIDTGKRMRLGPSFGRYYWLFVDQANEFTIVARDTGGKIVTAKVVGVLDSDRAKNSNPVNAEIQAGLAKLDEPKENVSLRYLNDPDIAYLRIRGFEGERFSESIDTAFRTLREKGTVSLILDLRGNGGGVDQYGALLVSQFTGKPFRYFDRIHVTTIHPSFATWKPSTFENLRNGTVPDPAGGYLLTSTLHSGVAEQAPAQHPFLGKVVVLIDGGTFSTAADVSAVLHHLKRAIFVGDETGGAYEGNTSGLNALIKMPNSKLGLKIPMYGYWNAVSLSRRGRGTQPDYRVDKSVTDLLRGVDSQLQRALTLARMALRDRTHPR